MLVDAEKKQNLYTFEECKNYIKCHSITFWANSYQRTQTLALRTPEINLLHWALRPDSQETDGGLMEPLQDIYNKS